MVSIWGVVSCLISGAAVMYLYLQITGKLRDFEHEAFLVKKIKELKAHERYYLSEIEKRKTEEQPEKSKWRPKTYQIAPEKLQQTIQEALGNIPKFKQDKKGEE